MIRGLIVVALTAVIVFVLALSLRADHSNSFYLLKEEGTISYKNGETGEYSEVTQDEISLPNGAFVKTGDISSAHIVLPDNSVISLDEKTELQVNFAEDGVEILQLIGKTWNRVETLTNGKKYEVKTGDAVAAVRGTIFGFEVDPNGSIYVNVEESKVDLSIAGSTVTVEEDQTGEIIQGFVSKKNTDENFKKLRWYIRNRILDLLDRKGLDNIFLKDKFKKELFREDLIETRYTIDTSDIKASLLNFVIDSSDPEVCSKISNIPSYITYSKFSGFYNQLLGACEDNVLSLNEIDELATLYNSIK